MLCICLVLAGGSIAYLWFNVATQIGRGTPLDTKTIVIMPFETKNAAGDEGFLGPGFSETLRDRINSRQLRAKNTDTLVQQGRKDLTPIEAARALACDAAVYGTVEHKENALVIDLKMTRTRDGQQVLDKQYVGEVNGTKELINRIRMDIGAQLWPQQAK
jgi:TolB-like protein